MQRGQHTRGQGPFASVHLTGDELTIVPFLQNDVFSLAQWGRQSSNLYREYDYAAYSSEDLADWYLERHTRNSQYFAIWYQNKLIGFIGLKQISWFRKSSVLGFAIDPNYSNQGFGTKAMALFFDYYFHELGFRTMDLYVYAYNTRAIRVYEKLGFHMRGMSVDVFQNPMNFPTDDEYAAFPEAFYRKGEEMLAQVYHMRKKK